MSTNFPSGLRSRGVPLPSGGIPPTGGNVFHVDSGHANASDSGPGTNPNHPMSTLDAAIALCTANNGDQIWVYPGHAETVSAAAGLDLDVAGITIIFLGNGNDRGTVTFGTAIGADMDVDAADITLINPRFVAGLDNLTAPLDVNSARFKMFGATYQDGTTINTIRVLVADANADNMVIDGFEFIDGDAAGTQKQSLFQIAAATGVTLRNIKSTGDYATGVIENNTAWIDALLENLVLDNANTSPTVALLLQGTSTGWVRNSSLRVASGVTGYTAVNDMQFDNVGVVGTDQQAAGDGVVGQLADAAATGAVTATDTLVAYIKQIITMLGPTELDVDTLGEILAGGAGITTWPTAVAYGNSVNMAEVIAYIQDGVRRGTGTTMAANKSVADAIGFDGSAVVAATAGMLRTAAGTLFVVKKALTSSAIVQAGVDVTGVSSVGDIQIEDVVITADATGLAGGTNLTLETNNAKGATPFFSNAITALGAQGNISLRSATTRENTVLESTKKIVAKCTVADCTGTGTIDVYLICRRLADNATLAAA